jgi:hypothetical protein
LECTEKTFLPGVRIGEDKRFAHRLTQLYFSQLKDIHNMASSNKGVDEANLQALPKEMKIVQGVLFL